MSGKGSTAIRKDEKVPPKSGLAYGCWMLTLVVSLVFILVGLLTPNLIEGTQRVGEDPATIIDVEQGLAQTCIDSPATRRNCEFANSSSDFNNGLWEAALWVLVVSVLLQIANVVTVLASYAVPGVRLLFAAQVFGVLVNWLHAIALVFLIPFGFRDLDSSCSGGPPFTASGDFAAASGDIHCGLVCDVGDHFSAFSLCFPFELGFSGFLLFVGAWLHFFATILSIWALRWWA